MVDKRPWTVEEVVMVGKHGNGYLMIAAGRNPRERNPNYCRWSILRTSVMCVDGGERWIIGKREYPHYPSKAELVDFLDYIWWERNEGFRVELEGRQTLDEPIKRRTGTSLKSVPALQVCCHPLPIERRPCDRAVRRFEKDDVGP